MQNQAVISSPSNERGNMPTFSVSMGYIAIPFPLKLHQMLDDSDKFGTQEVVSWLPGKNGLKIHYKEQFEADVLPKYFPNAKFRSFQRQLNHWEFTRLSHGEYTHPLFIRGKPDLCRSMKRIKIKGLYTKKNVSKASLRSTGSASPDATGKTVAEPSIAPSKVSFESLGEAKCMKRSTRSSSRTSKSNSAWPVLSALDVAQDPVVIGGVCEDHISCALRLANASTKDNGLDLVSQACSVVEDFLKNDMSGNACSSLQEGDRLLFEGRSFFFVDDAASDLRRMSSDRNSNWFDQARKPSDTTCVLYQFL